MRGADKSDLVLSLEQEAAVASEDRAVVVVASAGSGKTEVVARRVQRLLLEDPHSETRVLALTYTNKAADELRDRLRKRLGALSRLVDTDTIHGFAHSVIRQHGTKIGLPIEPELLVRDEDRAELLVRWLDDEGKTIPEDLLDIFRKIDLARARCQRADYLDDWEAALSGAKALDYPALLSIATDVLGIPSTRRQLTRLYRQVIVDEAQNLTPAQYRLIGALIEAPEGGGLTTPTMLVGDDKQSIVSFAGADPSLIQRFISDYSATKFQLNANFRSARAIAQVADAVAKQLGHQPPVGEYAAFGVVVRRDAPDEEAEAELVSDWIVKLSSEGLDPEALAEDESRTVRYEDIAVLGRSAGALRHVARALEKREIPVASSSGSGEWLSSRPGQVVMELVSLQAAGNHQSTHWQLARLLGVDESEVTTVEALHDVLGRSPDPTISMLSPLCSVEGPAELVQAIQVISVPMTTSPDILAAWQSDIEQIGESWTTFDERTERADLTWGNFKLFCSRQQRGDELAPGVRVLTIHKSQGREFRAVAVVGLNEGQIPDFRARTPDEILAELRTFYVAVSRPTRSLLLTRAQTRQTRYGSRPSQPSSFLGYLT